MTKDEALKLGIESLEWHNQHMHRKISEQAISAMKEVLVQPEQDWIQRERAVGYREGHQNALKQTAQQAKPCGLECDCTDVCKQENYKALWQQMCERCDELDKRLAQQAESVYITPPQGIYYTPPQRKPLTDEEIKEIYTSTKGLDFYLNFARAIEAAHGIIDPTDLKGKHDA